MPDSTAGSRRWLRWQPARAHAVIKRNSFSDPRPSRTARRSLAPSPTAGNSQTMGTLNLHPLSRPPTFFRWKRDTKHFAASERTHVYERSVSARSSTSDGSSSRFFIYVLSLSIHLGERETEKRIQIRYKEFLMLYKRQRERDRH